MKLLTTRVYSGRFTQNVKEQFTDLTYKALRDFIRSRVNERLKSALADTDPVESSTKVDTASAMDDSEVDASDDGIETTPEEIEAFRIIQAIASEIADPSRVYMRDAKAYCAILWDDNNRKPISRLFFLKTKMSIQIFLPDGEEKIEIQKVPDIYQFRHQIQDTVKSYIG